jgi:hypothetical protein
MLIISVLQRDKGGVCVMEGVYNEEFWAMFNHLCEVMGGDPMLVVLPIAEQMWKEEKERLNNVR